MSRNIPVVLGALSIAIAAAALVSAQDAALEKTLMANERAVNAAVVKGDTAGFTQHVSADGWAIDPMGGRMPIAEFVKGLPAMAKDMKVTSWDLSEPKMLQVDANTVVLTYKWTGSGTYQGKPLPSPTWASTVWTKKSGKWTAVFHQESLSMPPGK
jgi:hypothetical protein